MFQLICRLFHRSLIFLNFSFSRVEGGELFDYVSEQEKLSEELASMFVKQILEGSAYMHERNIVHLDLKVGANYSLSIPSPLPSPTSLLI